MGEGGQIAARARDAVGKIDDVAFFIRGTEAEAVEGGARRLQAALDLLGVAAAEDADDLACQLR